MDTNELADALGAFVDTATLAEVLGIPDRTLLAWRNDRTGPPFVRIGRHVRYRVSDVQAWLEEAARTTEQIWRAS